jgi:hypothetical protein
MRLADRMASQPAFGSIDGVTVRDDAPGGGAGPGDGGPASAHYQPYRRESPRADRPAVAYGGIEQGIRKRLDGLDYEMADQALLPDDRIREWVRWSVAQMSRSPRAR